MSYLIEQENRDEQFTQAFIMVENILMQEINDATCKEDIENELWKESKAILSQNNFPLVHADDIVDQVWKEKRF